MVAKRMVAAEARAGEIVVVRLAYGELLLESIQEICRQRKIRDGVILTGFGLAEIALIRVTGIKLARLVDDSTGQRLLHKVQAYPRVPEARQEGSRHVVASRIGPAKKKGAPRKASLGPQSVC